MIFMQNVIMCCSTLNTKGGMVSVTKNYLSYSNWGDYRIDFIPTHFDTKKWVLLIYFAIQFAKILFAVKTRKYNIAHLHTAERGSFWRKSMLMKFFHRHGIKVILHHHAAEFEDFYAKCSELQKEKIRKTLAEADLNIVLSERLISMIKDKEPSARVEVLYNAVPSYEKNPYSLEARNVLFMGRLGVRKGTFDLIEAIKRLDDKIPEDVKFYLCGDMGENEVRAKVKELGVEHRIAHVGWIDGAQKKDFISKSMINCLPSYNEGLPMTILETMAAGIPNISTNIASIPEVIMDGENGFLIEPGDVDALTEKLLHLIVDEKLRSDFSEKSYNLIKNNFSIDSNIIKLKEIFRNL
ncbi:Glycosyltransferase involved in cell wall bisynthesis [Fibrobacter sp. UWH9]|nr:Glycosyltransferase involved in cell wall bisynthesis [Fibrobacter sp. UWH9]